MTIQVLKMEYIDPKYQGGYALTVPMISFITEIQY